MIGRIIWFAALIVIGMITAAVQLDRETERNPALAPLVPAPFRNFAQTQITAEAVTGSDPAAALAEAERLVRRRPMPAEYLTLLAAAQVKAGEPEAAALTIQIAGQRGWRQPAAQEAVLRLALAAGDEAEAARRYTALLLRRSTDNAVLQELGPAVVGEPNGPGRQTMIAIISGAERWTGLFLRRGLAVMPPAAFAEVTAGSIARGAQFNCETLAGAVKGLALRDEQASRTLAAEAERLCPGRAPRGPRPAQRADR